MKTVILVNVGTPESAEPKDVGIYLNQFLMNEDIISIPRPFRDILVKCIIVPRRKFSSAAKYKKIWTEQGSPLMVETKLLQNKLQKKLGIGWNVVIGMQVGLPRLDETFAEAIKTSEQVYFCPLFPQYATATTGGATKITKNTSAKILKPFYNQAWFIQSQARLIKEKLRPEDHLLLSYHGLPVSQLKAHSSTCYQDQSCCQSANACQKNCYKAQCLETTKLLEKELGLSNVSIGFQSRLGPATWIEPSTETVVTELAAKGIKHLKVACPSFVSDCLETREEIGLELKHKFLSLGGESFELISCVNDDDQFTEGLAQTIQNQM